MEEPKLIIILITILIIIIAIVFLVLSLIKKKRLRDKKERQLSIIRNRTAYNIQADYVAGQPIHKTEKRSKLLTAGIVGNISGILDKQLFRIGVKRNTAVISVIWIIFVVLVPAVIYSITNDMIPTTAVLAAALIAPFVILRFLQKRRTEQFENQLADAITVMQGAISSGRSFRDSLLVVAKSSEDPIKTEFSYLFNEISLGTTMSDALENLAGRVKSADVEIFCTALIVQSGIGGNLILILGNIADTIRTRNRLKREIKAKTASGRLSGIIVALLPIAIFLFIRLTNPTYITDFTATAIGKAVFATGIVLMIIGAFLIKKITDIKY